jgi:hypothetical protein
VIFNFSWGLKLWDVFLAIEFSLLPLIFEYEVIWEIFLYEAVLGFNVFLGLEVDDIFILVLSKFNLDGLLLSIFPCLDSNFCFLSFKSYRAGLGILHFLISVGLYLLTDDFFWDDEFLYRLLPIGNCLSGVVIVPFIDFSLRLLATLLVVASALVRELRSPLLGLLFSFLAWALWLIDATFLESIDHNWFLMLFDRFLRLLLKFVVLVEDKYCFLDLLSSFTLTIFLHWALVAESSLFELYSTVKNLFKIWNTYRFGVAFPLQRGGNVKFIYFSIS